MGKGGIHITAIKDGERGDSHNRYKGWERVDTHNSYKGWGKGEYT